MWLLPTLLADVLACMLDDDQTITVLNGNDAAHRNGRVAEADGALRRSRFWGWLAF
jgi:hypothetical protein